MRIPAGTSVRFLLFGLLLIVVAAGVVGRDVTSNHHALVETFGLMDNYYGPGDQSALGHRWITQGFAGDWVMK